MSGVTHAVIAAYMFAPGAYTRTSGTSVTESVPSGATQVVIEVYGAGGGGGLNTSGGFASGGGGGAYVKKTIAVVGGNSMTFTIATGGPGRVSTQGNGTSATATTVTGTVSGGTLNLSAGGGAGGNIDWAIISAGGVASGGDINFDGSDTVDLTDIGGSGSGPSGVGTGALGGTTGAVGNAPGGGGGGNTSGAGGSGARGQVVFTYT